MKKIILFLVVSFSFQQLTAQETQFQKNAIYGSIGFAGLYGSATGYYERIIKQNMWNKNISSFVNFGYGGQAYWGGEGTYFLLKYGILTGVKKHHFEASFGPVYGNDGYVGFDPYYFEPISFSGSIGWRRQKPQGNFIMRGGIAYPESFYVGVGVAF